MHAGYQILNYVFFFRGPLLCPRLGGIMRWSASVVRLSVRLSVCPSVCLMSRTSALTRKLKGLGRRNFAQGTPGDMRLPHRLQGQKVKSQGHRAGAYCGGHLAAQLVLDFIFFGRGSSIILTRSPANAGRPRDAVSTYRSPHFCFPWRRPCNNHAICCTDGKTIQCLPNSSQHLI